MNATENKVVEERAPAKGNRPYAAPVLSEYGDVRQITLGGGSSSVADHGHNHMS
jgi:hypothetical protein